MSDIPPIAGQGYFVESWPFQQHRPHPFCASSNLYNLARVGETEGDLLTKSLNIEVSEESTPT